MLSANSAFVPEVLSHKVKLSNDVEIPVLGFGSAFGNWIDPSQPMGFTPEEAWRATKVALDAGVRHFDCALIYRSQMHVRDALSRRFMDGEMVRSDIFLTTKVFMGPLPGLAPEDTTIDMLGEGVDVKGQVGLAVQKSLEELGMSHVDLLLAHIPGVRGSTDKAKNREARSLCWEAFEDAYKSGKARAIGVSNWSEEHIEDLKTDGATVVPHVNQIEMSPHVIYDKLIGYCQANGIVIEAYSPFGSTGGACLKDDVVVKMAAKYGKDPAQLVLRWLVQQGMVVVSRSSTPARVASNMDIFDFEISKEDMATITALNKDKATTLSPYSIL